MVRITKEKVWSKILVTLVALLGFIYIGVAWYFQDQFLYGTRIGIVNVSYLTVEEAEERFSESLEGYVLTLESKDGQTAEIAGEDIDLAYNFGDCIRDIKDQQNPLNWLGAMLSQPVRYDVEVPVVYTHGKLEEELRGVSFLNPDEMVAPVDAKLNYTDKEGFSLQPSVEGNEVDRVQFQKALDEALLHKESQLNLEEARCYRKPKVTEDSEEIRKITDRLDEVSDFEITYSFGETKEVIDKEVVWSWYRLDKKDQIVLNENAVRGYVEELAKKYNTVGAKRKFKTTGGALIEVSGGPYGWRINQKKETQELLELVKARKSQTDRQPVYQQTGFEKVRSTSDIGDTYVEISITNQHMWYYENGKLFMDTDVVTGKGGRHTKRGVGYIQNKARNATLVGEDYVSFVKYWMKVWGGIGIHDASWRSKFGGKIYLTNGSHGCINTPLNNVIKLYNQVKIGTPVVIY